MIPDVPYMQGEDGIPLGPFDRFCFCTGLGIPCPYYFHTRNAESLLYAPGLTG